jgi:hypothetical protein
MVKLVAACPKVSISNLTEQITNLALLNVWCGGFSDAQSLALASGIREKRDLVSIHLQNSPSTRILASSISQVFANRALYLRLVVWNLYGEEMMNISRRGVVLESRVYTSGVELFKNYLPRCRSRSFLE